MATMVEQNSNTAPPLRTQVSPRPLDASMFTQPEEGSQADADAANNGAANTVPPSNGTTEATGAARRSSLPANPGRVITISGAVNLVTIAETFRSDPLTVDAKDMRRLKAAFVPFFEDPPSDASVVKLTTTAAYKAWAKQKKIKFTEHERAADIIWAKDGADMIGIIFD
mmetsp:Transcript_22649/g.52537  ORF Transcript_22649/g.52537 Transcript_22649/m.52537 type:complete len:169 (-) Transcript_22649:1327-1833(-)|eukprot:CAMPEP_0182601592 /NCGR_PEP_ID=MMETSP1324-20130603/91559_1 /TAXON_ID=236786 /ORGANISM="Florenciella sp., Strain RCC1587" /LENGTH=168 /DNA_ID=CAMNT_0024819503 /DNA_START=275 /DNA_END=781 /DNA_ORIENTATION=-